MEVGMSPRFSISLALALLTVLVFVFPAFAGGWAIITLDELPVDVVAGQPLQIGFTVRQHGVTPLGGLDATIMAHLPFEELLTVHAKPEGEQGHYTATLTFPKEGNWEWSIQAFTMEQEMAVLSVGSAAATVD
jgi:hypothetical protein